VQNAIKHAQAQSIGVRFRIESNCLRLIVSDDGCGFDVNARYQGHLGLHTMRERTELHDGKLSIVSQPGAGTTITVLIPRD
jgi:signal transduction histidine kinase